MRRVSGLLLGGVLGLLLGGAATQLLFLVCVMDGPDAESCGMGTYFLVGPALLLAGGVLGAGLGLLTDTADKVRQLARTLQFAVLGGIAGLAFSMVLAADRAGEVLPLVDTIPAIAFVVGTLFGWATHKHTKPVELGGSLQVQPPVDSQGA